ncbi:hypothetical protein Tco_1399263, partial [Tanacetum coccineum]
FDEFFSPPASVASLVPVEEAPAPVESTGSPSSTTVDQDAPSPSTSQTTPQSQSQTIPLCAKEESHDLEVSHMSNDPYFGIPIPETVSKESSSSNTYKDALTQSCWIEAMQEELHEFERLEVWELVPRPDKSPKDIFLNQSKYSLESLKKYEMKSCDPVDTPIVEKSKLDEDTQGKVVDPTHYRSMAWPTEKHLYAVKRIFRYLRGTINRGLWYSKDSTIALTAFAGGEDDDHAACQDTSRFSYIWKYAIVGR